MGLLGIAIVGAVGGLVLVALQEDGSRFADLGSGVFTAASVGVLLLLYEGARQKETQEALEKAATERSQEEKDERSRYFAREQRMQLSIIAALSGALEDMILSDEELDGFRFPRKVRAVEANRLSANGALFAGCSIADGAFKGAQLRRARFDGASIRGSSFRQAVLTDATFRHARLSECSFEGADLEGVSLEGASLREVSFRNARLPDGALERVASAEEVTLQDGTAWSPPVE